MADQYLPVSWDEFHSLSLLLADDIADSGKTFARAISYLGEFRPKSITTASLFYKPHSSFKPDFFAEQTDRWILLPHEVMEWITTFTKNMTKKGASPKKIDAFLKKIGYNDSQIGFAQKYYLE